MNADKIGSFIKELRTQKNMTQKELAQKINCTDKAISRWETGRGIPEISMLIPLSEVLDISVNELLLGERFIIDTVDETVNESVDVPEIFNKTDKNIIDVIIETSKEIDAIKKRHKDTVKILLLGCIHLLIIIVLMPEIGKRHYGWPATEFLVTESVIISFLVGLLKSKMKWVFPVFGFTYMAAVYIVEGDPIGAVLCLYVCIGLAVVMLLSIIVGTILKKLFAKIKIRIKLKTAG